MINTLTLGTDGALSKSLKRALTLGTWGALIVLSGEAGICNGNSIITTSIDCDSKIKTELYLNSYLAGISEEKNFHIKKQIDAISFITDTIDFSSEITTESAGNSIINEEL